MNLRLGRTVDRINTKDWGEGGNGLTTEVFLIGTTCEAEEKKNDSWDSWDVGWFSHARMRRRELRALARPGPRAVRGTPNFQGERSISQKRFRSKRCAFQSTQLAFAEICGIVLIWNSDDFFELRFDAGVGPRWLGAGGRSTYEAYL